MQEVGNRVLNQAGEDNTVDFVLIDPNKNPFITPGTHTEASSNGILYLENL